MSASAIRDDLLKIIGENPGGHQDAAVREAFAAKLEEYSKADGVDHADVVFAIGKTVFGVELEAPPAKKAKTNGDAPKPAALPIVDFEYMKRECSHPLRCSRAATNAIFDSASQIHTAISQSS